MNLNMNTEQEQSDQSANQNSTKKRNIVRINKKLLPKIIFVALMIILLVAAYYLGVKKGEKNAETKMKESSQQKITNNLATLPIGGTVEKITSSEITIKMIGESKRTAKINSKTEVSNRTGKIKVTDIKENNKVIIQTKTEGSNLIASRIIVQ